MSLKENRIEQKTSDSTGSDQTHPDAGVALVETPHESILTLNGSSAATFLAHYNTLFADLPADRLLRLNGLEKILVDSLEDQFNGCIAAVAEGLAWKEIKDLELFELRMTPADDGGERPMTLVEFIESLEIAGVACSPSMVYKKIIAANSFIFLRERKILFPRNLNQSHLLIVAGEPEDIVIPAFDDAMRQTKGRLTAEALEFAIKKVKGSRSGIRVTKPAAETKHTKTKALIANIAKCANIGLEEIKLQQPEAGKNQFTDILGLIGDYGAVKPKAPRKIKPKKAKRGKNRTQAPKVSPPDAPLGASAASQEPAPDSANGDAAEVLTAGGVLPTAANPRDFEGYSVWCDGPKVFVRNFDLYKQRSGVLVALKFERNEVEDYWSKEVSPDEVTDLLARVEKTQKLVKGP